MIKGHVSVKLHNVKTGEDQVIEHDNMVTNAVKEILPYQFGAYPNMIYSESYGPDYMNDHHVFPIATQLLGGIMLFDGKLTEDAAHFYFPSEAHLIGFAGRSLDSSHPFMGSINSLESGSNERGYVTTWDFNTSQCNGSIAALSLTHGWINNGLFTGGGLHGYNRLSDKFDDKKQLNYYFDDAKIRRQRIPATRFKLKDKLWVSNGDELVADETGISDLMKDIGTPTRTSLYQYGQYEYYGSPYYQYMYQTGFRDIGGWYFGYDGKLYMTFYGKNVLQSGSLKQLSIQEFKSSDHSFEKIGDVYTVNFENRMNLRDDRRCISNGYLYIISYDNAREVVRVNLSNPVDQFTYTLDKPADLINALPYGGAKVYYTGNYDANKACDILYPDGETRSFADKGQGAYSMWGCGGYLGTICNLGSPIEKTSAQTMKITYTLTDADDDTEDTAS